MAHAGVIPVGETQAWPSGALAQVQVYEDRTATLDIQQVSKLAAQDPGRFIPATPALLHRGHSQSAWWLEFNLANTDLHALSLRLVLGAVSLQWVDFYLERQGSWSHAISGQSVPLAAQTQPSRQPTLGFRLAPGEHVRILARVQSSKPLNIQPRLYTEAAYQHEESWTSIWTGFLLGEFAALGLAALFIAVFSASPTFACLGMLGMSSMLYEAALRGYAKMYLWPNAIDWVNRSTNVLGCLALSTFVLFFYMLARQESVPLPPGRRYFLGLAIVEGTLAAMCAFSDAPLLGLAGALSSMVIGISLMYTAFMLMKRSIPYGKFTFWFSLLFMLHVALRVMERNGTMANVLADVGIQNVATNPVVSLLGTSINFMLLGAWITQITRQRQDARRALEELRESEHQRLQAEVQLQTQALNSALKYADDKNRQQTEMLGYISHDLRAPLATIVSYAHLLRETQASGQAAYIRTIERSANYQLSLIDDLLEYAKSELQPLQINPAPADTADLLQDLWQHATAMSAHQNNQFQCKSPDALPARIMVDVRRIKQVLFNLLSNAAKFTHNGTISLLVHAHPKRDGWVLDFTVADSGIGIPHSAQTGLFKAFSQVQPRAGGTGLGLFIAKHIVEQMGGDLQLESAPDIGSRFSLQIRVVTVGSDTLFWKQNAAAAQEPDDSPAIEGALPPTRTRLELAILARDGQLTGIEEWIEQTADQYPDAQGFIEQIKAALLVLDFPHIEALALSAVDETAVDI